MGTVGSSYDNPDGGAASSDAFASATLNVGQNMNQTAVAAITEERTDTGWEIASNVATFTGTPDRVVLTAMAHQDIPGAFQRPAPVLHLQKRNGTGAWADFGPRSATGYIRGSNDHNESSNTVAVTDANPGTDPGYRVRKDRGSSPVGPCTLVAGQFTALAVG